MNRYLILLIGIVLFTSTLYGQTITDIKFEYDAAGNRTDRIIVYDSGGQKSALVEEIIEEPEFAEGLNVYPNPATHSIYVTLNEEVLESRHHGLYVFDNLGKLIIQINTLEAINQINVSDWPSSTYILKLIYDNKHEEWIVVKN